MLGFDGQDFTYVQRIDWSSRSEERENGSVRNIFVFTAVHS